MTRAARIAPFAASVIAVAALLPQAPAFAAAPPVFALKWSVQTTDAVNRFPSGLDVDALGRVWVLNRRLGKIEKYDSFGNLLANYAAPGSGDGQLAQPWGLGLDAAGNVYVADTNNHRIQKFSSSGVFLMKFGAQGSADGQLSLPADVAVDPTGNIYVADEGNDRLQKFDASGNFLRKWVVVGGDSLGGIWGVAADAGGNVYANDGLNSRVFKLDTNGDLAMEIPISQVFNLGVAVGPSGRIYVPDHGGGVVDVFDAAGAFLYQLGSPGSGDGQFMEPLGVGEDSGGDVFVSDRRLNRVTKFVPNVTPARTTSWGRIKSLYR